MIIKVVLILGVLAGAALILRGRAASTQLAVRRIAGALVAVTAVVAILWPTGVTLVANAVGVGRGTDLVLYVLVLAFLFVSISLYQRMHDLQNQVTTLTRAIALLPDPDDVAASATTIPRAAVEDPV